MAVRSGVWLSRFLKFAAMMVGGPLAVIAAMSLLGAFIDNHWARLGLALVVVIVIPVIIADRLLPADVGSSGSRGIISDVLAISWLGFVFLVFGAGVGVTQSLIDKQARRFETADYSRLAKATRWLGGRDAELGSGKVADVSGDKKTPADKKKAGSAEGVSSKLPESNPGGKPMKPGELFKQWAPSVVTIATEFGSGTGFIIASDGTLVTNEHVVGESTSIAVKLKDGTWADDVELLVKDGKKDLAILRISTSAVLSPVVMADSETVTVGEHVISIGNPLGLEHTLTDGLISARRKIQGRKMIQTSAPVSPGNSGGPLFNMRGEVIGVTTAIIGGAFSNAQNLNVAVPINEVKTLLKDDYPDAKTVGGGGPTAGTW